MASASALAIGQEDLDVFERLLGEIQTAYAREDAETFGRMTTPEMLSYFSRDLADNAKKGLHNEVSASIFGFGALAACSAFSCRLRSSPVSSTSR